MATLPRRSPNASSGGLFEFQDHQNSLQRHMTRLVKIGGHQNQLRWFCLLYICIILLTLTHCNWLVRCPVLLLRPAMRAIITCGSTTSAVLSRFSEWSAVQKELSKMNNNHSARDVPSRYFPRTKKGFTMSGLNYTNVDRSKTLQASHRKGICSPLPESISGT